MKRNANIAHFFKPFQQPKQLRLGPEKPADSTTSSASSARVSHLPTSKPTPTANTSSELQLTNSDSVPAPSPPSSKLPSDPATRVASLPSPRHSLSATLDPPLHSDIETETSPSGMARSDSTNADALPDDARNGSATLSFSSLPPLSQNSNASSRRVVKDGVEMVRTSDSEEDSDSSLEDLSVLLASRKRPAPARRLLPASSSLPPPGSGKKDYNFRSQAKRPKKIEKLLPPPPKYKMSLAALAKQASKERAAEEKSREAEVAVQKLEKLLDDSAHDDITDENLVEAIGDADRVKQTREALERSGVLEKVQVWRFFDNCRSVRPKPFPVASLPSRGWQTLLNDSATRESAVHSGLVYAGIARSTLPDEVVSWMIDEVCFGTKAELKLSYLRILGPSTPQIRNLLGESRIRQLFSQMGATGLDDSLADITPTEVGEDAPKPAPPDGLPWLLRLLHQSAPQLTPEALECGLEVLLRVNFDDCVCVDLELQTLSREAISAFLATLKTSFDTIARRTYACLHNYPILQSHLITSLPAHTPVECNFRRRLALCFLLRNSTAALTTPLTSRAFLESIFAAIIETNPNFQINDSTDYAAVAATANILDAAFENGFSDFAFVTELASTPQKLIFRDADAKGRRQEARRLEDEFNEGIDKLARLLTNINGRVGGGVEKMTQTVAKITLDRVMYRMEYGVRTKESSAKDPFRAMVQSSGMMENWITKGNGEDRNEEGKDQGKEGEGGKRVLFAEEDAYGG